MKNRVCDKYYIAQTKGEAKKLGLKEPHFCSLEKGHKGPHVCPGKGMHNSKGGGAHETPFHFEVRTPSMPRNRVVFPRSVS
jgi:hypothetical protein